MNRFGTARRLGLAPLRPRRPPPSLAFRRWQSDATRTTLTRKPYYVTTPIFYVNAQPHIGHMYSMVLADVLKRWQTVRGRRAVLVTGTDEHGLKVQQAAAAAGVPPKQFCDETAATFQELAAACHLAHDRFIRTTDADHQAAVRAFWRRLRRRGYVYRSTHAGWYCVSDETFYPDNLVERRLDAATGRAEMVSTETGKPVEWTEETNYHFRMTAVRERLLAFYAENPEWVVPASRMSEVVAWVTHQLTDLSISRPASRLPWAVRVPDDAEQTVYVWVDALTNYLTTAGYPERWAPEEAVEAAAEAESATPAVVMDGRAEAAIAAVEQQLEGHGSATSSSTPTSTPTPIPTSLEAEQVARHEGGGWPADVHVLGKDIVRFHAVYWPALLLAVDLPLPKRILSHAHWTLGHKKMSKSVGNVVDPFYAIDRFGLDALRYYLVHDGGIDDDGDYGNEHVVDRYKKGLQGGLGNLLGRMTRTSRWSVREAVVRAAGGVLDLDALPPAMQAQADTVGGAAAAVAAHMDRLDARQALRSAMDVVYATNRFVADAAPWDVAKRLQEKQADEDLRQQLDRSVYLAVEALRVVGILLQPVMPGKADALLNALGVGHARRSLADAQLGADYDYGVPLGPAGAGGPGKPDVLFPPLPVET